MVLRFFRWLYKKIGLKTITAISLLLFVFGSSVFGIANFVKELDQGFLLRIVFLAIIFSWLFARSKLNGWISSGLLILLGVFILFLVVGNLFEPLLSFGNSAIHLLWEILNYSPDVPIDHKNIELAYAEIYYGISGLVKPLSDWFGSILRGTPRFNETAISLVWGLVCWLMATWGSWSLRRLNRPIIGILPIGILLSAGLAYTWESTSALSPFLFSSLLLIAFANYSQSEQFWVHTRMDYPEDLPKEFSITTTAVVIGIVAIASILPIVSIKSIVAFVYQFTQPRIEEAESVIQSFGLEQGGVSQEDIDSALRGGFPRGHLIGSGPELSQQLVMTVKVTGGIPQAAGLDLRLPLYWRSLTYDQYLGSGWKSSDVGVRSYDTGTVVVTKPSPYHHVIQQDFRMTKGKARFLYAAGDIITADSDFKIAYRQKPGIPEDNESQGDFFGASIDQSSYTVQSYVPYLNENTLNLTQMEYPEWLEERYLTLPDTIPPRVGQLAIEITEDELTPFDKVRALESYLRSIEYSLNVEVPPDNTDLVDYFLFELQKGYCDYYASALVVMSRSIGIPARLAIGYYQGLYDEDNHRYIVTEADAHSWVEIFFQEIGWIPFEPTAGRPPIEYPLVEFGGDLGVTPPDEIDSIKTTEGKWNPDFSFNLFGVVLGLSLVIIGIIFVDHLRLNYLPPLEALSSLYQRLYRHGTGLKILLRKDSTPHEFALSLVGRIEGLSRGIVIRNFLSESTKEILDLSRIYELSLYSPLVFNQEGKIQVIRLWKRLRRRLVVARLRQIVLQIERILSANRD